MKNGRRKVWLQLKEIRELIEQVPTMNPQGAVSVIAEVTIKLTGVIEELFDKLEESEQED